MALIPTATYEQIADDYDEFREQSLRAICKLLDATQAIVDLTGSGALIPEVDLLNPFYGVWLTTKDNYLSVASLLAAVRAINNHVLTEGGYNNLTAYVAATGASMPYFWAELCNSAGFTVSGDAAPTDYPFCDWT